MFVEGDIKRLSTYAHLSRVFFILFISCSANNEAKSSSSLCTFFESGIAQRSISTVDFSVPVRQDLLKMVQIFGWPEFQVYTSRNVYSVTPFLVTCTVLWRFHTTSTRDKGPLIFGKLPPYCLKF